MWTVGEEPVMMSPKEFLGFRKYGHGHHQRPHHHLWPAVLLILKMKVTGGAGAGVNNSSWRERLP